MPRYFTEAENIAHYAAQPKKSTGVMVAYANPAGEILIVKPNYKPGWNLVGGFIDPDESPLQAAIRETHEETGLVIEPERLALLGLQYLPAGTYNDFLRIVFSASLTAEEAAHIAIPADELEDFKFVTLDQLAEYKERSVTQAVHAMLVSKRQVGYVEGVELKGPQA